MIHQYKNNGYNIVMDVNSGAVHVVDDIVYNMIPLIEPLVEEDIKDPATVKAAVINCGGLPYQQEQIEEAVEEVLELEKQGQLFAKDIYEDCFAEEGEYHGRRALMSFEVGKKALDFLVANSGNRVNLEVDFFGGEPLMNWQVVKDLVAYGRSLEEPHHKKFRFTLTTNGVLLDDDILEFANKEMGNLVLSIDGRKEVHDKMRPFRGGQGSYDTVVPKFIKAARSREQTNYYVRGTFTHENLDFAEDVLHLADLGFEQISVEPVVAPPEEEYALKKEDIPKLLAEYDKLAAELVKRKKEGKGFNFFHFMIDLEGGPCVAKRLSGCGSGAEYLAVTPWGDFYPCHQFVGMEEFLLGNVEEGIVRQEICNAFKSCNVYAKEKCKKCFAKFYCSGGCAANSYHFTGSINDVYDIGCELQKKRVECAIMIKAAMAE